MKKSVPIIFFGSDAFSTQILDGLIADDRFEVELVVTKPRRKSGRNRRLSDQPVMDMAERNEIGVLTIEKLSDQDSVKLKATKAQVGVLASFGSLLPPSVLEAFEFGIINVHPSLLPRWRGASPIEAAILHGDDCTGVSIIKLVDKMDAGPIFAQQKIKLNGRETQESLYIILAKLGSKLLLEKLPGIVNKTIKPKNQDEDLATYAPLIKKADAIIDWNQTPSEIERQIRAYNVWPQARSRICNRDVTILAASLDDRQAPDALSLGQPFTDTNGQLLITAGRNQALRIDNIKPAGKREMDGASFVRGYCAGSLPL